MNKIPLCIPEIGQSEKDAVIEVLESGWLAHGEYNKKFESAFAEYLGVRHAITLNSCTSALELAIRANEIRGEVIVPSFTFVASVNSIITSGAVPVFCDVDKSTRNVTADLIRERITDKTEAVMIVHFGGQVCEMDGIIELCDKHNLVLIEDSAETLGACWKGRQAGSMGIGCFSFFPTKNITTGEGGMFTCNDDELAMKVRSIIGHGISKTTMQRENDLNPWERSAIIPGNNFRMSNILAAIGYHQLLKIDEMNAKRQSLGNLYNQKLSTLSEFVEIPITIEGSEHVYQMYTILVDSAVRNKLVHYLREAGIGASVHFEPPVHLQDYYRKKIKDLKLPVTEKLSSSIITLPMYPSMTDEEVNQIVDRMSSFFNDI